jgi:hypothetical protein
VGLFDFFKRNKNIITDNGTNYIYFDNGKGSIKEKFNKVNGVLNGEYIEYNRNGTFNIKTYIDGVIPLTELEIKSKNLKEEWNKSINDEIRKLKIIDDLISEISGIFLLVQMENSKIDYYSKLILDRRITKLDENYIKFYLYTKRNYFIKYLIKFDSVRAIGIDESLNYIDTINYYNNCFTEHIVNDSHDPYFMEISDVKVNYSFFQIVKFDIQRKLFKNFKVTNKVSLEHNNKGFRINKAIFEQQSILFGLNFNTYKLIHEIIKKKSKEFKNDSLDKDFYAQKVVNEILSICTNNKVNQKDIAIEL